MRGPDHTPPGGAPTPNGHRIIIVDDNYAVADGLKWLLEVEGHTVAGMAPTVEEALALVESTTCDFAILDVDLRGESVVAVARALAKKSTPFIFITGFGETVGLPDDLAEVARLNKPADPKEIVAAIARACDPPS